jgi:MFS family permease
MQSSAEEAMVSSTLMSEYSNRRDRGKLITLVFSTQALGLIVGPLLTFSFFTPWRRSAGALTWQNLFQDYN